MVKMSNKKYRYKKKSDNFSKMYRKKYIENKLKNIKNYNNPI